MSTTMLEQPHDTQIDGYLTVCAVCGHVTHQSALDCELCGSQQLESVPGLGEIYSYTRVHQNLEEGSDSDAFILALVQLADRSLIMGRMVGVSRELEVGMPVEVVSNAEPISSGRPGGLYFTPCCRNGIPSC